MRSGQYVMHEIGEHVAYFMREGDTPDGSYKGTLIKGELIAFDAKRPYAVIRYGRHPGMLIGVPTWRLMTVNAPENYDA